MAHRFMGMLRRMDPDHLPLIDSHCHLTWPDFDADLDAVVARMGQEGVERAICVATDPKSARKARSIADRFPNIAATAGMHPNDLPETWEEDWREIESMLRSGSFVAVGETGLDYYRDYVPHERQRIAFARHARLARELDLPLIVHIRDRDGRFVAYDDVALILEETKGVRGVIHCFTGIPKHAAQFVALGFYISFSGVLTFKTAENVRDAARAVSLDRTLVETDAPFLSPEPFRKVKRCEPSFVASTARRLAEVKGVSEGEVRRVTTENTLRLFGLGV